MIRTTERHRKGDIDETQPDWFPMTFDPEDELENPEM